MSRARTRSTANASRRQTQRKRAEPRPSEYAKEALSEWTKAARLSAAAARLSAAAVAPESVAPTGSATKKRESSERPSQHAKKALSEWGKAVRYGAASIAPVAKRARERTKGAVARRAESANEQSLRDRLNPAKTEKGGRIGDAADELLARLGTPGKLASKVSLGSRVVDKVLPSFDGDAQEPDEEEFEAEVIEPEPEAEVIEPEPEAGVIEPEPEPAGDGEQAQPEAGSADEEEDATERAPEESGSDGRRQSTDRGMIEFEYERDYAKRHHRRPPNAYPLITQ